MNEIRPRLASLHAVIFDCDGTLADSEPLAARAWSQVLAPLGYNPTEADILACLGRSFPAVRDHYAAVAHDLPTAENLWPTFSVAMLNLIATSLAPFDDAVALAIDLHKAGVPMAVATSSPRQRLDATLAALGVNGLFSVTVAGDEIAKIKPAPDVFSAAACQLGADPASYVVFEDSQPGVDAALAAGMYVIAVRRPPTVLLKRAHHVVDEVSLDVLLSALNARSDALEGIA